MLRSRLPFMFLLLFTGGCAFVDLNVTPPSSSVLAQPATLGRGREVYLSIPFSDQRPARERCGMQKNGYNMDTANVFCSVAPSEWLSVSLREGLTQAGFRVRDGKEARGASAVQIQGDVLQFFVEPDVGFVTFTPEADISVKLVVTSASGLRAERVFYVKGTEESLVGTENNFQSATNSATGQIVGAMVQAIAELLDRYLQLGMPEAPPADKVSLLAPQEVSR